jgi:hypothetical protein
MNLFGQFIGMFSFGMSCWALGDFFIQRLFKKTVPMKTLARHTLAFTSGNILFSYLLTAMGFSRLLIPSILWILFLAGAGFAAWRLVVEFQLSFRRRLPQQLVQEPEKIKEKGALLFVIVTTGLFLVLALLQAAAPPYLRDSLVYHLLCPKEYLKACKLIHIPGNIYSAFPKGHEVLMTLLLGTAGDRAAQGFSILQQVAAIGGLYSLIRLYVGPWPSAMSAVGYATVPPVIYFSGCGYVEPALLMTFASTLLTLSLLVKKAQASVPQGLRPGEVGFVAFLAGWMTALKYNGLLYLGLIGLILLWNQRKAPFREAFRITGAFILGAVPGLCWVVWNWVTLGNPVYPMGWFLFGGKGWDEERAFAMSLYFDHYGMGKHFMDYIKLPWRLSFLGRFDSTFFDGAIGPFLIIFLILALISFILVSHHRWRGFDGRMIGFLMVVSASFFLFGTQQARFWLPAQMMVCVFAAPALKFLTNWPKGGYWIKWVLGIIVFISLAWNMWFLVKQVHAVGYYRPVLGLESEQNFLVRRVPGYPALEFINQNLPVQARVFCAWTGAYGYYLNRPYYSDTFIEDATLKRLIDKSSDGKVLKKKFQEAEFTHLYVGIPLLEKSLKPEQKIVFDDFLRKSARILFGFQGFWVLAID